MQVAEAISPPRCGAILVTIITPAYNAEKYINRLAKCVLGQTLEEIEWIFVDDCSTDNTYGVISAAAFDPRLRIVRQNKNQGVASSRNIGLSMARGRYICFLDADDYWSDDKLALQYEFMRTHNCALSYMNYVRVNSAGAARSIVTSPDQINLRDMLISNKIGNLTAMVRSDVVGGLSFDKIGHEDYVFWLRVMKVCGNAFRVPDGNMVRCFYTVSATSLSANKAKAMKWQWVIYREVLGMGLMRSLMFFSRYATDALKKRIL